MQQSLPLWVSDVRPGFTHDLTAAREQVLPALYPHAARGLPVLADKGYIGAGAGVHTQSGASPRGHCTQTTRAPNAYAAGGRSVAVTSRVVEDYTTGRLPENQLMSVLVHELGHHATGAAWPMLLLSWLTAPWRLTARLLTGLANVLAGRQRRRGALIILVAGLAVAVIRTLHQGQWMVGGVLVFVGLAAVLCPLADAAISRRAEMAADLFAAYHGLASELAAALHALDDGHRAARGWSRGLLASHPTPDQRIRTLLAATAAPRL